jgi:hypothetical protein
MALTGCRKAVLSYVLLDNKQIGHEYKIDDKTRIKTFSFDFDAEIIETLQNKVIECRNFLKQL